MVVAGCEVCWESIGVRIVGAGVPDRRVHRSSARGRGCGRHRPIARSVGKACSVSWLCVFASSSGRVR